jgi:hypothetical protein
MKQIYCPLTGLTSTHQTSIREKKWLKQNIKKTDSTELTTVLLQPHTTTHKFSLASRSFYMTSSVLILLHH